MNPIASRAQQALRAVHVFQARPTHTQQDVRVERSAHSAFEPPPLSPVKKNETEPVALSNKKMVPFNSKTRELMVPKEIKFDLVAFKPKTKALVNIQEKSTKQSKQLAEQAELIKKMLGYNLFIVPEERYLHNLLSPGFNSINKAVMIIKNPDDKDLINDFLREHSLLAEVVAALVAMIIIDHFCPHDSADSVAVFEDQKKLIDLAVKEISSAIDDLEKVLNRTIEQTNSLLKRVEQSSLSESDKSSMKKQINEIQDQMVQQIHLHRDNLKEFKSNCQEIKPVEIKQALVSNKTRDVGTILLCTLARLALPQAVLISLVINSLTDTSISESEAKENYDKFIKSVKDSVPSTQASGFHKRQILDADIDVMLGAVTLIPHEIIKTFKNMPLQLGSKICLLVCEGVVNKNVKKEVNPILSKAQLNELVESGEIQEFKNELMKAHRDNIAQIKNYVKETEDEYANYLSMKHEQITIATRKPTRILADTVNGLFGTIFQGVKVSATAPRHE